MKKWKNRTFLLSACLVLVCAFSGCSDKKDKNTVTIIDGDFAEMKFFTQVANRIQWQAIWHLSR